MPACRQSRDTERPGHSDHVTGSREPVPNADARDRARPPHYGVPCSPRINKSSAVGAHKLPILGKRTAYLTYACSFRTSRHYHHPWHLQYLPDGFGSVFVPRRRAARPSRCCRKTPRLAFAYLESMTHYFIRCEIGRRIRIRRPFYGARNNVVRDSLQLHFELAVDVPISPGRYGCI